MTHPGQEVLLKAGWFLVNSPGSYLRKWINTVMYRGDGTMSNCIVKCWYDTRTICGAAWQRVRNQRPGKRGNVSKASLRIFDWW